MYKIEGGVMQKTIVRISLVQATALASLISMSAPLIAQEDNAAATQADAMAKRERQELQQQAGDAGNASEQGNADAPYQHKERERAELKEGKGKGEPWSGAQEAKGHGNKQHNPEGKAGPYGSKNKPQKGGR
jgi:hypothetical protein